MLISAQYKFSKRDIKKIVKRINEIAAPYGARLVKDRLVLNGIGYKDNGDLVANE